MTKPLAQLLAHLPQLNHRELTQIRDRANFLLGLAGEASAAPQRSDHDWLLEGLTHELRRQGLWLKNYPLPKALIPAGYAAQSGLLCQHLLLGASKAKLTTFNELRSLGALGASVLISYLKKIRVPVGPKTVLINIDKIPVALEESFPGYWESGLLGSCLNTARVRGGGLPLRESAATGRRSQSGRESRS